MFHTIAKALVDADLARIHDGVRAIEFAPGQETAGWAARGVKANLQTRAGADTERLQDDINSRLLSNETFQLAARPKRLIGPLISRYEPGHSYGTHIDNAILDGARADLAFTLFLGAPESYDGGELVIESTAGEESFKLAVGDMILYPATTLHRVAPVTRGVRIVATGWVRSYIRDASQRELLFDLDTARHRLFAQHGKTSEFDLLSKCSANLMRQWCDD